MKVRGAGVVHNGWPLWGCRGAWLPASGSPGGMGCRGQLHRYCKELCSASISSGGGDFSELEGGDGDGLVQGLTYLLFLSLTV